MTDWAGCSDGFDSWLKSHPVPRLMYNTQPCMLNQKYTHDIITFVFCMCLWILIIIIIAAMCQLCANIISKLYFRWLLCTRTHMERMCSRGLHSPHKWGLLVTLEATLTPPVLMLLREMVTDLSWLSSGKEWPSWRRGWNRMRGEKIYQSTDIIIVDILIKLLGSWRMLCMQSKVLKKLIKIKRFYNFIIMLRSDGRRPDDITLYSALETQQATALGCYMPWHVCSFV